MSNLTILDLSEAKRALPSAPPQSLVRVVEAASPAIFQAQDPSGYRRISNSTSERDLTPPAYWRMQRVAYMLYVTNGQAKALVDHVVDFLVGEGVSAKAEDDAAQQVIDEFWNSPFNSMDLNLEGFVREFCIFGEQLWKCDANPISGAVRLGPVDPGWIDSVEYATLESLPGRAVGPPQTVVLRSYQGEREQRRLRVIAPQDDPYSENYGHLAGECFYFAANKARAATRGISDIFAVADWIDGMDHMLFSMMDQMDSLSRFIWDVTLTGMTNEQIQEWLKSNGTAPRPNSVRAHNEKATWQAVAPSLNASDKSDGFRIIRDYTVTAMQQPVHWFGDGGSTNRATALEQGEPTLKMLTRKQRQFKYQLQQLLEYVIDAAVTAGTLPEGINRKCEIKMPDLSVRDMQKAASAIDSAASAMVKLHGDGALDIETMTQATAAMLTQIGVEADPAQIMERAKQETADRAAADAARAYQNNPPPGALPVPGGKNQGAQQ